MHAAPPTPNQRFKNGIQPCAVALVLLVIFFCLPLLFAAELVKIERVIAKEPPYQKGNPRYCLAVFGADAQTRVWLILDEDTLYVDRNADLDLTAADEKLIGKRKPDGQWVFPPASISAKAGVPPAARLEVSVSPELTFVICHTTNQPWQRAVVDPRGYLKFSDKPQTAPVLHFNGPLTMGLRFDHRFKRQSTPGELDVMVGTPGLGVGSFVRFGHEGIAQDLYPKLEILWPGNQNRPARLILKKRC